jgi:hypothetical protein
LTAITIRAAASPTSGTMINTRARKASATSAARETGEAAT